MGNAADDHFVACLVLLVITFVLMIGKPGLEYLKGVKRTRSAVVSDCIFVFACCISTANITMLCVKAKAESDIRNQTDDPMLIAMTMFAPKWLKVRVLPLVSPG